MSVRTASPSRSDGRPRLETRAWLRSVTRPGAERWIWPVVGAGWLVLGWSAVGWYPLGAASMAGHEHGGMPHAMADPVPAVQASGHLLMWVAMTAATMLPLIARNLRVVAQRSPRARRTRATGEVAAGWAAVWIAAGAVVSIALVALAPLAPHVVLVAATTGAAVLWQFARLRTIALARCHRALAPPLDRRASKACASYGVGLGRDCLIACWPAMLLMTVAGHQLLVVIALGWLSWRDIRLPHDRPGRPVSITVLLCTGAFAVLVPAIQG